MAVGSINNRTNGNNAKNKHKRKSGIKNNSSIKRKEAINELINELDNLINLKDHKNNKINKKHNKLIYLIPIFLTLLLIYLFIPKIKLIGSKKVNITYNTNYIESGYKASFLFKNITNKITIDSNIDNSKIGTYYINYNLKYGPLKFSKKRTINIIDDIKPVIEVDSKELKICPEASIPDINYQAKDEYDGIITDKVTKEITEDKIILNVKDSSGNSEYLGIDIIRGDTEAPVITLKGNKTIYLNTGVAYTEPGYSAIDNCDGDITDSVKIDSNLKSAVGTYTIKYSVTDKHGNNKEETRTIIVRNNNYNSGTIGAGTIYLTFDDGPNYGTTNVILDILKEEGVKATFFVTCNGPDSLIKRIVDEGHTIALHTATHDYSYVYSSVDNYFEDLTRVSNRVKNITGVDSKIIRFPGGSSNTVSRHYQIGIMSTLTSMVLDRGYRYYDWNVDSNDAGGSNTSSAVYANVVNALSKNRANMVLMHDVKTQTRDALRDIIHYAKNNGYEFKQIDMSTYMVRHGVNN